MKLKDTRIAEKLPNTPGGSWYVISEVEDTDIDIADVAEIDVEKLASFIKEWNKSGYAYKDVWGYLAKAIASSNCIKWREK